MTSPNHVIRVLIVDDHTIVRRGIKALLAETDDIEVIGRSGQRSRSHPPCTAARAGCHFDGPIDADNGWDRSHPPDHSPEPHMRVLVLTSFVGDEKIFPAIKAGALGYLLKDSDPSELIRSIYRVHRGEPSLHSSIARKMMKEILDTPSTKPTPDPLTAREVEVLQLLAKGLSNDEIAAQLVVSEVTVRTHISHLLAKLHLANRVQATLYALREGLSSLDEENK